jgi:hypothetical protein
LCALMKSLNEEKPDNCCIATEVRSGPEAAVHGGAAGRLQWRAKRTVGG